MRFQSYFNTAVQLIRQYNGRVPLVYFLKQYFAQHKKHGSKDRKWIAHLCYSYYRLGHALKELPPEERLRTALFLCNEAAGDWVLLYDAAWIQHWQDDLPSRIDFVRTVYPSFVITDIFPWINALSAGIDINAFVMAHLVQPDLFVRIRPGHEQTVLKKLADHGIAYQSVLPGCLALPNASKIDSILDIDREVVIQDYSSQRIAGFLQLATTNKPQPSLWDCCAASGGKSILAYDTIPGLQLTVSDIRPSIIQNLRQRFERAGIKNYTAKIADLASSKYKMQHVKFNIVVCDAPCSGSGTWSRTPEQLYFFLEEKINEYAQLQRKIIRNVMNESDTGGYLLYITCSVFKKENEEMVEMMEKEFSWKLLKKELLKGYPVKADTMFAALFQKA